MRYDAKEFKKALDDYAIGLVPSSFLDYEVQAYLSTADHQALVGLIARCGVRMLANFIKARFASNGIKAEVEGWTSVSNPTMGLLRWNYFIGEDRHEDSYLIDCRFWMSRE